MQNWQRDFRDRLKKEVANHFKLNNRSLKGNFLLHSKPIIFLFLLIFCYRGLLFHSSDWGIRIFWCLGFIFSMGGIGFGFAHDSCHGAFSRHRFWNRLTGMGYDLIGGSSYIWRWKHNSLHHSGPNHTEHDPDIQTYPLMRIAHNHPRLSFHRYQHLYFPFLYLFVVMRWHLWQDFSIFFKGELLGKKFKRPQGWDLFFFCTCKFISIFFAFIYPSIFLPFSQVILNYVIVAGGLGIFLGTLIQMAHCTEGASFEPLSTSELPMTSEEQILRSSNFSPKNHFITWYTGGLNYQIEHHLFPSIASVHYPALSKIVQNICEEYNVPYQCHGSALGSLKAHVGYLKQMGRDSLV